ncbi:MAG TPA: 50S ribosomal protein L10 [Candidatus Omnitrophica bacterium]|nr:50S ribosomal protein L10 [Candidatus Omnitrophota bacterium]
MTVITKKIGELYRDLVSRELKHRLDSSTDVFLFSYHKLKSAEMTSLRKNLKTAGASVLVTKNSFMKKAFETVGKPSEAISLLDGPMAMVFVKDDPIGVSKVLMDFVKQHEVMSVRGGFLAERLLSPEDIKKISTLFSRQALYGQVASTLNAPIGKLASTLNQIVTKLVYALGALKDKKEK